MELKEAIVLLIGTGVGASLTFAGSYLTSSRQLDAKMVEIGVSILRTDPKEDAVAARGWALRIIEKHSGTKFTDAEREALLKHALPYKPSLDFSDPRNSQYLPML